MSWLSGSCTQPEPTTPEIAAQAERLPIIDMHLHAYEAAWAGPPPVPGCAGARFPGWDPRQPITLDECATRIPSGTTDEDLMKRTIEMLSRYNIVKAVTSGSRLDQWKAAAPERIMTGLAVGSVFGSGFAPTASVAQVRQRLADRAYDAIAEFAPQYDGVRPPDAQLEPYFSVAEELDMPVGIHI